MGSPERVMTGRTAEERTEWLQLNPGMIFTLADTIGLRHPDPGNELHGELIDTLIDLGPGATLGQRIVAFRYVFNWRQLAAGREYAQAKADYEHAVTRRVVEEMAKGSADGRRMSLGWATAIAEDAAAELKLRFLLAEKLEQSLRKFLETTDRALDNHRTDRADLRAGDRAHAQGLSGGA